MRCYPPAKPEIKRRAVEAYTRTPQTASREDAAR